MKRFTFQGYSDDTFGAIEGDDYDNCASGKPIVWKLTGGGDSLLVFGHYCPGPATGWMIGIARADEDGDRPAPAWPMSFVQPNERDAPYTVKLVIEAPDDTVMEHIA